MSVLRDDADRRYLTRLVDLFVKDVRETLDPRFAIDFLDYSDHWEWRTAWSTTDGVTGRGIPQAVFHLGQEVDAQLLLLDGILDFDFEHVLEPWPLCPRCGDHPLEPRNVDGHAHWVCERDHVAIVRLGRLRALNSG
jgi:hypothetical protein